MHGPGLALLPSMYLAIATCNKDGWALEFWIDVLILMIRNPLCQICQTLPALKEMVVQGGFGDFYFY